jgi:predicted Rossmann fold nucleotide-binding protein DprA/Smf involved in DNA uptake
MNNNDIIATLVLKSIKGVGASAIKGLWEKGAFQNLSYHTTIETSLRSLKKEISDSQIETFIQDAKQVISDSTDDNIKFLHISDSRYPPQLSQLKDAPPLLFYKGNIEIMSKVVGIIGTREPDNIGLEISRRIGAHFHDRGYAICNGLAIGVDEASIRGTNGIVSNAIGVVAGGLNYNQSKTLLKATALLADQVLDAGGLLLSEFESFIKEDTFKVIKSCRLQAGLSHGLILVQSKMRGGSRYALESYCSLKRPLGVVQPPKTNSNSSYEANFSILENGVEGLSQITNLKIGKIAVNEILPIAGKEDYLAFEEMISNRIRTDLPGTLF